MLAFNRPAVQAQIQRSDVVELVRAALASYPDVPGLKENGRGLLSSLWSRAAAAEGASSGGAGGGAGGEGGDARPRRRKFAGNV